MIGVLEIIRKLFPGITWLMLILAVFREDSAANQLLNDEM